MRCLALVLAWLVSATSLHAADEPKPDPIKDYTKTLKDADIASDPKSLIEFIGKRTLSNEDRQKLLGTIQLLGDRDFDVREKATDQLMKAGIGALPILRAASQNKDDEIARRVERCLDRIAQARETERIVAVAYILASQKAPETVPTLLAYLPSVPDDEQVADGIQAALILYTKLTGKADEDIVKALTDTDPSRRAMAAQVLGESLPEQRPAVRKLLEDRDPKVVYISAATLLRAGDKLAIAPLVQMLEKGPIEYAYQAEDLLCQLLHDQAPPATLAGKDDTTRKKCREAWEAWIKQNSDKIELTKLNEAPAMKGFTLIMEVDGGVQGGRIWECGPDGKQRWEITNIGGPVDVQILPGGKLLIAEYYNARVTERDREGKVLWESPRQTSSVVCAQRLPNGNTLIGTLRDVVEINREGKRLHENNYPTTVFHTRRSKKGNTFVLTGDDMIEYDASWKEIRKIKIGGHSGWGGFELLPNGNFLIAYYNAGTGFAEVNGEGKKIWGQATAEPTRIDPTRLQRLRNGNTLVAGGNAHFVVEYDRNHKEVWKAATVGRPFSVLRY